MKAEWLKCAPKSTKKNIPQAIVSRACEYLHAFPEETPDKLLSVLKCAVGSFEL
jgi:hypothetical protein